MELISDDRILGYNFMIHIETSIKKENMAAAYSPAFLCNSIGHEELKGIMNGGTEEQMNRRTRNVDRIILLE